MKHSIAFLSLLFIFQLGVSCGNSTDPTENTDPVLSAGTVSHFHCELSWTQLNHQDHIFDSYHLYRSDSPEIASDTTVAECIVSFNEIDQLQYVDSLLEAGGDYYYTLLIRMHEQGKDQDTHIWSNEIHVATEEVIRVKVVNNYGLPIYVMVHHNNGTTPWLSISGTNSKWVTPYNLTTCEACIQSGDDIEFEYPEPDAGADGPRIVFSEHTFDNGQYPNLESYQYIYDKIETNWGPGAIWNTTCVDFFAIPIQITVNTDSVGFHSSVTRANLMEELKSLPAPYSNLNYMDLRFFSPSKHPEKVPNLLSDAIPTGLPLLVNKTCTWNWTYTISSTTSNSLVAACGGEVTLSSIISSSVLACTIDFSHSGDVPGGADANLAGMVGAAANRGVLYDPDLWGDPSKYYENNPLNHNQFNEYSRILHQCSIDSLCYAFPYDDNHNQHSGVVPNSSGTISPVTITILPKS
jgi:hypothetical protein